jgi:hypothetical protein
MARHDADTAPNVKDADGNEPAAAAIAVLSSGKKLPRGLACVRLAHHQRVDGRQAARASGGFTV